MFSTKRRPCHFNSLRMTKYISHIIHSCCATHMCMEHIHTPGPVMSRGNTNTVPRPYVNLVTTPPKERLVCTVREFFFFCGWYSRAHGGFVVLLLHMVSEILVQLCLGGGHTHTLGTQTIWKPPFKANALSMLFLNRGCIILFHTFHG